MPRLVVSFRTDDWAWQFILVAMPRTTDSQVSPPAPLTPFTQLTAIYPLKVFIYISEGIVFHFTYLNFFFSVSMYYLYS